MDAYVRATCHYVGSRPCAEKRGAVTEQDRALRAVEKAAGRATGAEDALRAQRAALKDAVRQAVDVGVSLSAIGRALGVSRQRVKQMLEE